MPYAPLHNAIMSIPHQKMASLGEAHDYFGLDIDQAILAQFPACGTFTKEQACKGEIPVECQALSNLQTDDCPPKKPVNWMVTVPLALVAGYFLLGDS